jgi:monovalent cation:proton antiporter-2 (CPA2) family protein
MASPAALIVDASAQAAGQAAEHAVAHASVLPPILIFCAAAVIAVPLFRQIGLGAILGYLVAGVLIGPSVGGLVSDPDSLRTTAELGVVLLLFLVGLELKLGKLFEMRGDIFGLGSGQMALTALGISFILTLAGVPVAGAAFLGIALALSATAVALQILEERGDLRGPYGQRTFAVLLFQDLSIVPVLAIAPLVALASAGGGGGTDWLTGSLAIAKGLAAIALVVLIGRYLLNPLFRVLAASGAREVMTAAALLVVLGTALLMERVGLSMAMGAFMAGLLLAESNFRHQLEADIEPFRGLLLGLFFMSVGMSLDLRVVAGHALLLSVGATGVVAGKIAIAAGLARLSGSTWPDALRIGALLAPAGEFAFVLVPMTGVLGLVPRETVQVVTALAALSMLLGPIVAKVLQSLLAQRNLPDAQTMDEDFSGAQGEVLVIGFGRFGQVVNQVLLAEGVDATVIDKDVDQIRSAGRFGLRVFFGDGGRLDVLRAAGAGRARLVCICVDDAATATRIVDLVHDEFPQARTYVRAYDRVHALDLMSRDVDVHVRETFESALGFGRLALLGLGRPAEAVETVVADVRRRDVARLIMQRDEGQMGGADLLHGAKVAPEPLIMPRRRGKGLTSETKALLSPDDAT